jgi:hypothetical protein
LAAKSKKDNVNSKTHRGYFRQYFQDMRLNSNFINDEKDDLIFDLSEGWVGNSEYTWYFHDFSSKKGRPPTGADITRTHKWLCKTPKVNNVRDFFKSNLSLSAGQARSACVFRAVNSIQKRSTQSYIRDLLKPYAGADYLDIQSFVEIVEKLGD